MHFSAMLMVIRSLILNVTAQDVSASSHHPCKCLTDSQAKTYIEDYAYIMAEQPNYYERANKRLKQDFKAYSDSYSYIFQHELNRTNTQTLDEHIAKHENTPREWDFPNFVSLTYLRHHNLVRLELDGK